MKLAALFAWTMTIAQLAPIAGARADDSVILPRVIQSDSGLEIRNEAALRIDSKNPGLNRVEGFLFEGTSYARTIHEDEKDPNRESYELSAIRDALAFIDRSIAPRIFELFPNEKLPKIRIVFDELSSSQIHRGFAVADSIIIDVSLIRSSGDSRGALALVAAHEIQHWLNRQFRARTGTPPQEDWLDEGLSKLMEYYVTGTAPSQAIDRSFGMNATTSLSQWPAFGRATELDYSNAFLFTAYLYFHFGKDELFKRLIQGPRSGMESVTALLTELSPLHSVPARFLTTQSLFSNYALALAINSNRVGGNRLFSLSGSTFVPELSGRRMQSDFMIFRQKGTEIVAEAEISPYQARYIRWMPGDSCLKIERPARVHIYLLEGARTPNRVSELTHETECMSGDATDRILVLVNLNAPGSAPAQVTFRR